MEIKEVLELKKELDGLIEQFVQKNKVYYWCEYIHKTYARIMYFVSHNSSIEKLEKVGEKLNNNDVERFVLKHPYLANYALHNIHVLHPKSRKESIRYIAEWEENYLKIDFPDIVGNCWDDLPLPEEVEDFLSRFKQDIYWESSMSWYFNHQESNYYQDEVENLQLRISSVDLTTLKFVLDNLQSITNHKLDICCLDYNGLFKEQ